MDRLTNGPALKMHQIPLNQAEARRQEDAGKVSRAPETVSTSRCGKLKPLSPSAREKALDDIRAWAGSFHSLRDSHRPLSRDELRALDGGAVEVGAHTVSHPSLTKHPLDVQKQEIRESKRWLDDFLGRSVRAFAYPYGDYSRATAAVVEQAGFDLACTTQASAVFSGNNSYELPRIAINDWDGPEFACCLAKSLSLSTIG